MEHDGLFTGGVRGSYTQGSYRCSLIYGSADSSSGFVVSEGKGGWPKRLVLSADGFGGAIDNGK